MQTYKQSSGSSQRPQIGVSFFGFVLIGLISGAWGVLLPSLSSYYHVDNSVVGLLFFSSATGYFLSALASGFLVQKLGQRWYLVLGAAAFLVGNFLIVLKLPFAVVLLTRLAMGMGVAMIEAGLNMFVARLPNNTSLLNYLHAFFGAGALVGPLVASGMLALHWQWNYVFFVWCIATLPFLVGVIVLFKRLPTETPVHEARGEVTARESGLVAAFKLPIVWLVTLFLLFYCGIEASLGNWGYSFLLEHRREGELLSGWIVSSFWLGLTLGRFVVNDLAKRLRMSVTGMMYSCLVGIGLGVLILWLLPGTVFAILGFVLLGFSLGPIYPTTVAMIPSMVPSRVVSDTIGFVIGLSIIGIALFPWIAGVLAQYIDIVSLLPYTVALALIMVVLWMGIARQLTPSTPSADIQEVMKSEKV